MRKITFNNITKYYYNNQLIKEIFHKINFSISLGEMVLITGPSGSGKTTLLNIIAGIEKTSSGEIYVDKTKIYDFDEYRKNYVSYIYQESFLVGNLSVYENIKIYSYIHDIKINNIDNTLEKLGILHLKNVKAKKLSGGEKQRVSIARSLIKISPILICDEPTAYLDYNNTKIVYNLLIKESKKRIVIISSHKPYYLKKYATKVIEIKDESIKEKSINQIKKNVKITNFIFKFRFKEKILIALKSIKGYKKKSVFICLVYLFLFITLAYSLNLYNKDINYKYSLYNVFLKDYSMDRLIINKKNKTFFTKKDINEIKQINSNILIKDDLFLDETINVKLYNKYYSYKLVTKNSKNNILFLDDKNYKKYKHLNKKTTFIKYNHYIKRIKIKIRKSKDNYIVLTKNNMNKLKPYVILNYSDIYVNDLLKKYVVKLNDFPKEDVNIVIKNPYNLIKVDKAFISDNTLYLDKDVFKNYKSYQKSLYIKNKRETYDIKNKLINRGFNVIVVKDTLHSDILDIVLIISYFKKIFILLIMVIIILFSYFILNAFIKSNNEFYKILHLLEATKKEVEEVIFIEMFILENLVLLFVLILSNCLSSGITNYILITYFLILLMINIFSKKGILND